MDKNITIVTGLWNLDRETLTGWAKRDFNDYKTKFFELLSVNVQMCIWIPKELESDVLKIRGDKPTKIFIKNVKDFETWNPFFQKIQSIRNNPSWKNLAEWLSKSPQSELEYYNAMMFTKMFMVNNSAMINPFNSKYFFWLNGGITNTVNSGYFNVDNVLYNLENFMLSINDKFLTISYPYTCNDEIHGFERIAMSKYCKTDFVDYVCRGSFFGGEKELIHTINSIYFNILEMTLSDGYMGTDECIFTILSHIYKDLVYRFEIGSNGLIFPFFEELKKYKQFSFKNENLSTEKVGLYVISFNSPSQFETLINSMIDYDIDFIKKPKKFLLDNSTDLSTTSKYKQLCEKYGFEHIKKNNLGICGGRQWIAEHFNKETDLDYYFFFEDDMFFYKKDNVCKNGFNRFVPNLYSKSLEIIKKEKFDFLKMNYTEFYGDNGTCWAWYNVPQSIREKFWPNNKILPEIGLDSNAPKSKFNSVLSHKGVPYITGEIYYSNWPQIVSKHGNKKMFLETTWEKPFEQTWMSFMYQLVKKDKLYPGLLLMTPTEHNRFEHYDGKLRKES